MKNLYFIVLSVFISYVSSGQELKPVAQKIYTKKLSNEVFTAVNLFEVTNASTQRSRDLSKIVSKSTVSEINIRELEGVLRSKPENIRFSIPSSKGTVELLLYKTNLFSPDFSVVTSEEKTAVDYKHGLHYWGVIEGNYNSHAAISIFDNEVMGSVSSNDGNQVLGKLENDPGGMHIYYNDRDLLVTSGSECGTIEPGGKGSPLPQQISASVASLVSVNCIRLYWEANFDLYQSKGSSTANVTNYLTGLFNQSAIIYTNDSIPVVLTQVFVWTTTSPYTATSTSGLLDEFQAFRNSFNGDLGHLIGLSGGGGIAAGFNGLCNSNLDNSQCYSGISNSYNSVPTYSWSVEVVTHEQGHLMGSRHTHACVWNGNNTAIDNCGPNASYAYEGSCSGAPTPANGGTIMSYCHLVSGVGINFNNGFGAQPRTAILNKFNAAACLTACTGTTCLSPLSPLTSNLTTSSVTFNWTAVTGAVSYDIQYRIVGTTTWISANTTNTFYNVSGLTANANYEWQVRTVCSSGNSVWTNSTLFITTLPPANDNPCSATPITVNTSCIFSTHTNINASGSAGVPSPGCASYGGSDVWFSAVVPAGGTIVFDTDNLTMTDGAMAIYSGTCSGLTLLACDDDGSGTNGYMPLITLTGQAPSSTLWARVWSYANNTNGTFKICASYPASACSVPANLSTSNITTSSATFTWASVTGAVSYNIQYRIVGTSTWLAGTSSINSFNATALSAGANYEWQVQTVCPVGNSPFTVSANFTTLNLPCSAPSGMSTTSITTTTAIFNWTAVSGAVSYIVRYRIIGTTNWQTGAASANSYNASLLSPASNYEWQVQTICTGGSSAFTSPTTFVTATPPCNLATGMNTTLITATSATFNWIAVIGANSYNIRYRIVGTTTWSAGSTTINSFNATSLAPVSVYEWQVQTICAFGSSNFSTSVNFTTATPACDIVTGTNTTLITTSTATLNWTAVTGANSYNIRYRIIGAATWSAGSTTTNSFNASSLTPVSTYEWQVQSVCTFGSSNFSSSENFTTETPPCDVAKGMNTTLITTSTATFNWTAVPGAISYNIRYRIVGTTSWISGSTGTNSYNAISLSPVSTYEWEVQSVCTSGSSNFSLSTNFTTTTPPCDITTGTNTTLITANTATFNWNAVTGANSYTIRYRIAGTTTWSTGTATINSFNASSLTPVSLYEWQVQSVCTFGNSNFSSSSNFTTATPPCDAPTGTNTTLITTGTATFNWNAVTGANSYTIRYRIAGTTTWSTGIATTNLFNAVSLTPVSLYEWQVQSVCTFGNSNFSSSSNFTTATPPCDAATGTNTSLIATGTATFNWNAVTGANSYNIRYRILGTTTWSTGTATTNSFNTTSLTPVSIYEWQVQTVCTFGNSNFSASVNFTTATPPCDIPSGLGATIITTTSATLNWNVVPGASAYTVFYRVLGTLTWSIGFSPTNSFAATLLDPASLYEWEIQSVCSFGKSALSPTSTFITETPACDEPSGLFSDLITTTSATLNWAAVPGATSYTIHYRPSGSSTWSTDTSLSTFCQADSLEPATVYEYEVQAVCAFGISVFSPPGTFTTATPPCDVPAGLMTTFITTSGAEFTWQPVLGALTYEVSYRVSGTTAWTTALTSANSFNATGLLPWTNYEWQVQATCAFGISDFTLPALFTTVLGFCQDNYEPNNSKNAGAPISTGTDIIAMLEPLNELDWYEFTNTAATPNMKITLSNLVADYDLRLYPTNGTFVDISQNRGTVSETIIHNTSFVGLWRIRVDGFDNAFNADQCYILHVELSSSPFNLSSARLAPQSLVETATLNIFPNPAQDRLTVEIINENSSNARLNVYNLIGEKLLFREDFLNEGFNQINMNTSDLKSGIYILELENGDVITRQRFSISE